MHIPREIFTKILHYVKDDEVRKLLFIDTHWNSVVSDCIWKNITLSTEIGEEALTKRLIKHFTRHSSYDRLILPRNPDVIKTIQIEVRCEDKADRNRVVEQLNIIYQLLDHLKLVNRVVFDFGQRCKKDRLLLDTVMKGVMTRLPSLRHVQFQVPTVFFQEDGANLAKVDKHLRRMYADAFKHVDGRLLSLDAGCIFPASNWFPVQSILEVQANLRTLRLGFLFFVDGVCVLNTVANANLSNLRTLRLMYNSSAFEDEPSYGQVAQSAMAERLYPALTKLVKSSPLLEQFRLNAPESHREFRLNLWKVLDILTKFSKLRKITLDMNMFDPEPETTPLKLRFDALVSFVLNGPYNELDLAETLSTFYWPELQHLAIPAPDWTISISKNFLQHAPNNLSFILQVQSAAEAIAMSWLDSAEGHVYTCVKGIQLVVMDAKVPLKLRADGHVLCMRLRETFPNAEIHAVSGDSGECCMYYGIQARLDGREVDPTHMCPYWSNEVEDDEPDDYEYESESDEMPELI
jgi:hypothetical protein